MASGLIYLIIIGMWVAYFLPRWISTHDDSSGRSGEKFKTAMKVVGSQSTSFLPDIEEKERQRKQITQRRTIFSGLTALFVASFIIAVLGFIAWSMLLIPFSALAIYFVNVRRQVVASQLKIRRLRAIEKITQTPIRISPLSYSQNPHTQGENDHWIPLSERAERSGVVVIPKGEPGWDPVSVPRPTYTTAAKAITPKRIIDLTIPGAWSAEQELLKALDVPARSELFDQELAEAAAEDNGRAVNE